MPISFLRSYVHPHCSTTRPYTGIDDVYYRAMDSVPIDILLPYPIYLKIHDRFIQLRNRGDKLEQARVAQLIAKKVDAVFISQDHWLEYTRSLESSIDDVGLANGSEEAALGLRNVLYTYWKSIEETREVDPKLFLKLQELTSKMPIAMSQNRKLADVLLRRYQEPSVYFANHSINIAVYSVALGLKLKMLLPDLQKLALAALTANIGIIRTPKEILYKPAKLTPEEWTVIKEHPVQGASILKLLLVPHAVSLAAKQHHERFDGKGYPDGLAGREISLPARIISIAEVFNALTSARPWAPANHSIKAIEMMGKMDGKFDPEIFVPQL